MIHPAASGQPGDPLQPVQAKRNATKLDATFSQALDTALTIQAQKNEKSIAPLAHSPLPEAVHPLKKEAVEKAKRDFFEAASHGDIEKIRLLPLASLDHVLLTQFLEHATTSGSKELVHLLRSHGAVWNHDKIRRYQASVSFQFPKVNPTDKNELIATLQALQTLSHQPKLTQGEAWMLLGTLEIVRENYQKIATFPTPTDAIPGIWPPKTPEALKGSRLYQIEGLLWSIIDTCVEQISKGPKTP